MTTTGRDWLHSPKNLRTDKLRLLDMASARQGDWNVAGPEGPKNFEQNRTDCQQ
jgi:hypothetical protein